MIGERGAFVLLVAIAVGGCRGGNADASAKADADASAKADASASAKARRVVATARVPGIGYAAVTREREVVSGGVGLADVAARTEATGDTIFEAASIAKTVIATCVMQLVEQGRLDLDADAAKYVGFPIRHPHSGEPITLGMLLTHRASILDHDDELLASADDLPLGQFLQRYLMDDQGPRAGAFLDARPGSTTAYSNVGAALAALAVERISGESFVAYSMRRVFKPLRMTSTGWRAPSRERFVVATPHALRDSGFVALPPASHAVYPVVDLRSSARDLARFARAMLREGELEGARILSPTSVRRALAADAGGDPDQALAWQLRTIGGRRVAGHEGEDAGTTSALFLDLAAGAGAIVLANGDAFSSGDRERAAAVQNLVADLLAAARCHLAVVEGSTCYYRARMADPPQKRALTDPEATTVVADLEDAVPAGSLTGTEYGPVLVAGRYEILGMLGAGGMGTVYRARDRELDEIVALKLLKQEIASAAGMLERFRREVKLARRVTHRNVARTFDIGEHAGDRFLTMELIEGEMLGAYLAKRGRIPLRDVVRIGVDVCAGLAAAHAAGVLHRDLKPENVILARDGRAVITDFGIARALVEAELGRTVGGTVGTPAYMAPEQVEGATDLDARTDLYALGAMLFELLSGKAAWPGDSVVAIAAGRVLRPPPDVRIHLPDVPEAAALLVLKLMARARTDRFATAEEAGEAIAALSTADLPSYQSLLPASGSRPASAPTPAAAARAPRKTVAVLPLLNLGAADDEYLAQILTEDLVDLLSVVPELRVRPRGETARFHGKTRDVRAAGRELGVDVVVDGSVRRVGELVRVSVRLVAVEDGFQLWARRFDGPPAHVLNVADDAASAIALALATERTAEPRPVASDAEAQELYLRGRYLIHRAWFEVSRQGVELLREAHRRAPDDARIAGTYALAVARVLTDDRDTAVATAEALELAERTLKRDPGQPEARVALGFLHINSSEGAAAALQLKKALAVSPNSVEALDAIGRMLVEVGRPELGIATLRRALAIDPLMAHAMHAVARCYALLGDVRRADQELGPVPVESADFVPYTLLKGRIALWTGDREAGRALEQSVAEATGLSPFARSSLLGLLAIVKTRSMDAAMRAAVDASLPVNHAFSPRRMSYHAQIRTEVKLASGEVAEGLSDLRAADSNGLLDLLWLDRCPVFDNVRSSPEFLRIRESTVARTERVVRILDP